MWLHYLWNDGDPTLLAYIIVAVLFLIPFLITSYVNEGYDWAIVFGILAAIFGGLTVFLIAIIPYYVGGTVAFFVVTYGLYKLGAYIGGRS